MHDNINDLIIDGLLERWNEMIALVFTHIVGIFRTFLHWLTHLIHLEHISGNFMSLTNTKTVQGIHELLQVNVTSGWQKELLVQLPGGAQAPEQAGFRSQVKWNPQMHLEPALISWVLLWAESNGWPLIKHPQHVQQSGGGFLLITTATAGNSRLIVLSG